MKRENFGKAESIMKELQDIEWWLESMSPTASKVIIHCGTRQILFSERKDDGHLHDQQHNSESITLLVETIHKLKERKKDLLTTLETL